MILLIYISSRNVKYSYVFLSNHHLGFEAAAWYWHFDDKKENREKVNQIRINKKNEGKMQH